VCGGLGSLNVANRNRLGLVRSGRSFHSIESPLAHSKTELRRTGHSRALTHIIMAYVQETR